MPKSPLKVVLPTLRLSPLFSPSIVAGVCQPVTSKTTCLATWTSAVSGQRRGGERRCYTSQLAMLRGRLRFQDREGVEKDVVIQAQESEIAAKQANIEHFKERERVFEEERRHFATLRMR